VDWKELKLGGYICSGEGRGSLFHVWTGPGEDSRRVGCNGVGETGPIGIRRHLFKVSPGRGESRLNGTSAPSRVSIDHGAQTAQWKIELKFGVR